jgi:hypothetical protein
VRLFVCHASALWMRGLRVVKCITFCAITRPIPWQLSVVRVFCAACNALVVARRLNHSFLCGAFGLRTGGIWGGMYDPKLQIGKRMMKHDNKNDYIQDASAIPFLPC